MIDNNNYSQDDNVENNGNNLTSYTKLMIIENQFVKEQRHNNNLFLSTFRQNDSNGPVDSVIFKDAIN